MWQGTRDDEIASAIKTSDIRSVVLSKSYPYYISEVIAKLLFVEFNSINIKII